MPNWIPQPPTVRIAARPSYLWLKAAIDTYLALLALAAFGPLMGVLALLVRRDSPGPALFSQERAGQFGRGFRFFKFRTMRTDADPYGDSPESGQDPRITALGNRLRETSLDELPQLFNVIQGQMAVVGPRPLFVQQIAEWCPRHRHRLLVRPGLTGFSQIHGRASIPLEDKLDWDIRYVERISLKTDLLVIFRTFFSVLNRDGLYQTEYSRDRARFRPEGGAGT